MYKKSLSLFNRSGVYLILVGGLLFSSLGFTGMLEYWGGWHRYEDLRNADFRGETLRRMYFKGSDLTNASFVRANLKKIRFKDATLINSNFRRATLYLVDFHSANLKRANFKGSTLKNVNFRRANLRGADLRRVFIGNGCFFGGATYNRNTIFPHGFDPERRGMRRGGRKNGKRRTTYDEDDDFSDSYNPRNRRPRDKDNRSRRDKQRRYRRG